MLDTQQIKNITALESATIGQPVKVQDIINGKKHAYEDTVLEEMLSLEID
ncbi:hypothetical protein [Bacillus sp. AFS076308]|nr:hypothetical protein [Bacillus sp. AFS076308]